MNVADCRRTGTYPHMRVAGTHITVWWNFWSIHASCACGGGVMETMWGNNAKTGVSSSWLPAVETCPGASTCKTFCYAARLEKFRTTVRAKARRIRKLVLRKSWVVSQFVGRSGPHRLHASGDIFCKTQVNNYVAGLRAAPSMDAWTYTRSYRVPALVPAVKKLADYAVVFASVDTDLDYARAVQLGLRRAKVIDVTTRSLAAALADGSVKRSWTDPDGSYWLLCPEQTGAVKDCAACGYCFNKKLGNNKNVAFARH